MPRLEPVIVTKLWGAEFIQVNTPDYCGKIMVVNPGFVCSRHKHEVKDECFSILDGVMSLEVGSEESIETFTLEAGQVFRLEPGTYHRFNAVGDWPCTFVEFSTHDSPEDSYRLEPSRPVGTDEVERHGYEPYSDEYFYNVPKTVRCRVCKTAMTKRQADEGTGCECLPLAVLEEQTTRIPEGVPTVKAEE